MANSVIPRGVRYPTFETVNVTLTPDNVVLGQYTEFYNSGQLDANYIHLFVLVGSCTAPLQTRFFVAFQYGGQMEAVEGSGGASSAYSLLGVSVATTSTAESMRYYFSAKPTSNVAFRITHIAFPI